MCWVLQTQNNAPSTMRLCISQPMLAQHAMREAAPHNMGYIVVDHVSCQAHPKKTLACPSCDRALGATDGTDAYCR